MASPTPKFECSHASIEDCRAFDAFTHKCYRFTGFVMAGQPNVSTASLETGAALIAAALMKFTLDNPEKARDVLDRLIAPGVVRKGVDGYAEDFGLVDDLGLAFLGLPGAH